MSVAIASKYEALTGAGILNLEFDDLIYSCTFLTRKGDLIFPQAHRVILKIFTIRSLKSFNSWLHLPLKLEKNVSSEAFTELCELLDQASIISRKKNENTDRDILWTLRKWFDLFLQSLLEIQLLVIDNESLLYVSLLLRQFLLLIGKHLLIDA